MSNKDCTWDFFIAHSGADERAASELFDLLSPHARVFLDSRCLLYGDEWDQKLTSAQQASRVTVVLVSSQTEKAYYAREEIAAAITMARHDETKHKVVPVYLDQSVEDVTFFPYGLRLKHGMALADTGSIAKVAEALLILIAKIKSQEASSISVLQHPITELNISEYSTRLKAEASW